MKQTYKTKTQMLTWMIKLILTGASDTEKDKNTQTQVEKKLSTAELKLKRTVVELTVLEDNNHVCAGRPSLTPQTDFSLFSQIRPVK